MNRPPVYQEERDVFRVEDCRVHRRERVVVVINPEVHRRGEDPVSQMGNLCGEMGSSVFYCSSLSKGQQSETFPRKVSPLYLLSGGRHKETGTGRSPTRKDCMTRALSRDFRVSRDVLVFCEGPHSGRETSRSPDSSRYLHRPPSGGRTVTRIKGGGE